MNNADARIKNVFVIIPLFNEAPVLSETIFDALKFFQNVVVVNDGSTDESEKILRKFDIVQLNHAVNLGQGAAIRTGFEYILSHTEAEAVVTFDADGQHDIDDAVRFAEEILKSREMVIFGSRFLGCSNGMPIAKKFLLQLAVFVTRRLTNLEITDTHNGLKAFKRSALPLVKCDIRGFAFESEMLKRIVSHNISFRERPCYLRYTAYSRKKGQKLSSALRIVEDLFRWWRKS